MDVKRTKKNDLSLLLLQESLWGVEDKIKVISETIADHEAELIRLRNLNQVAIDRLNALEINNNYDNRQNK